jgi:hypothetical protein
MKTTLDLPEALVRQLELRAASDGREPSELVADLLAASLAPAQNSGALERRAVPKSLPLIKVRPAPPPDSDRLTTQEWCDWLKDVDLQLDVERYEKALGYQHVDRADG